MAAEGPLDNTPLSFALVRFARLPLRFASLTGREAVGGHLEPRPRSFAVVVGINPLGLSGAITAHVDALQKICFCSIGSPVSRIGVYPGSFNPPTRAHLEIALAAVAEYSLQRLDFALSVSPLGKAEVEVPTFRHRIEVIEASLRDHQSLAVVVTEAQLITDIADGYDLVVMGADKWHQVNDPGWYNDDVRTRDEAVSRLPTVALAPRPPHVIPAELRLPVPDDLVEISSTAARAGRTDQMTTAAAQFDAETGAWTDPTKYQRRQITGI